MKLNEVRQAYLDFFSDKGHVIAPSASLLPENDATTLFTSSGMQPMLPYLLGESYPGGKRVADAQKCFRAQDVDEVGDNRHTTLFEMLGNWSFGDYFKAEQIPWIFEFLTQKLGLDPKRLYVTVFRGSEVLGIPRDDEAVALWQKEFSAVGIEASAMDYAEQYGMQGGRIFYYDERKNWWSRSGVPANMPPGEPGGPDTELFWDFGTQLKLHENSAFAAMPCHVNCDCGRFMEIGNNVFMEYRKTAAGFERLEQRNVDFGGGLERLTAAVINSPDIFRIDAFQPIIETLQRETGKIYGDEPGTTRAFRIIADHVRAAVFLIGDPRGVMPSNVGQGYVVRNLIRRAIRETKRVDISPRVLVEVAECVIDFFGRHYGELSARHQEIVNALRQEEEKFGRTLEQGLKELNALVEKKLAAKAADSAAPLFTGDEAFYLFQTYGFPEELIEEELRNLGMQQRGSAYTFDRAGFHEAEARHRELSQTASAGVFKGGLADHSVETTRLHTATHLLHRALKNVLGDHVEQRGSNITAERLRFDFSHPQKMTPEEILAVETMVNEAIQKDFPVNYETVTIDEARRRGAIGLFEEKYGSDVKVYTVGDDRGTFSMEICGGPHVAHTGELGAFKIQKEEAVSAGIRRIKATVMG